MYKDIKTLLLFFVLINCLIPLGHCSTGLCLKDWYHDKENVTPPLESLPATIYSPVLLDVEPCVTLKLFFLCPSKDTSYSSIRSIALACSNGQILETVGWNTGTHLPFVKFQTRQTIDLKIKASDCPITLTLCCLSTFLSCKVMREHLHSGLTTIPLKDHKLWSDSQPVTLSLTLWDLFFEDGTPTASCLEIFSPSPSLRGASYYLRE